jgi:dTDP-4-dehydrorhamnose reductase
MNKKMNILITGANGQLGSEFRKIEKERSLHHFYFTDIAELDITNPDAVSNYITHHKIDIIVNCAAYTAVDKAEKNIYLAEKVNITGPEVLAKSAKENNCKLIHISTDYVFDGSKNTPYTEDDLVSPLGVYGDTKYRGEQAVISSGAEAIIIRTSWLYSSFGNNFVKTMIKFGKERESLNVIFDQIGTPSYAGDLAEAIITIIDSSLKLDKHRQVYHFSNHGVASWYDFAVNIMKIANIDCLINPIETKDYPANVVRPFYSVLNKSNIIKDFKLKIPYWKDSLTNCIDILT